MLKSLLGGYVASFDDVLGGQDEDEDFLHNPLNVYNLIRHVAVGWHVVEDVLSQVKMFEEFSNKN